MSGIAPAPESKAGFFVAGGTLPLESGSYVKRIADSAILKSLTEGRFCYVLNSRQMGKSSLCVRTMAKLAEQNVRCAFIDITKIGGRNVTPEQWYAGLAIEVGRTLGLRAEVLEYWKAEGHISPMQRFFGSLHDVVLAKTAGKVVVFVDEIDSTRSLPFNTDEFFAGVRECFNRRVQEPEYERLTFCFLGVAVPSDLIHDARTTPFNIGERIYLRDFSLEELKPLAAHLGPNGLSVLERVYYWTNGHPFLTQSICRALVAQPDGKMEKDVDELIQRDLLEPKVRETNINLSDVGNRVLNGYADDDDIGKFRADILSAYSKARAGREVLQDDESNRITAVLKLSGLMRSENGALKVRNRIYEQAFDREWIKENMPGQELRRQRRAFYMGVLRTGAVALVVVAIIAALAINSIRLARIASEQRDLARYESYAADMNLMRTAYDDNDLMLLTSLLEQTKNSPNRNMEWYYWNAKLHDGSHEIDTPNGSGRVNISVDGKTVAIKDNTKEAGAIYSYPDLKLIHRLGRMSRDETVDQFAGRWVISGIDTLRKATIKDAVTGAPLGSYEFEGGELDSWTGSAQGNATVISWIAKGDYYPQDLTVWDNRTFKLMHHIKLKNLRINSVSVSDNGRFVATEEVDAEAQGLVENYYAGRQFVVRDLVSGAEVDRFPTDGVPTVIRLSDDGKYLGFGLSSRPVLRVRDVLARKFRLDVTGTMVNGIYFSADNRRLLTEDVDLSATLWDVSNGKVLDKKKGAMSASMPLDASSIAVSGAGTRVYTTKTIDKTSTAIPNTWTHLFGINERGWLVVGTGHALRYLDAGSFQPARPFTRLVAPGTPVSSDANWRLSAHRAGGSEIVSTSTGEPLCRIPIWNGNFFGMDVSSSRVAALDAQLRFAACFDRTGKEQWRFDAKASPATACRWSPDGSVLAVGTGEAKISLLDAQTGKVTRTLQGYLPVTPFSHDGRKIAVFDGGLNVLVIDLQTNAPPIVCPGHSAFISSMAFSLDDKRLGTTSGDGTARLWDPRTGKQMLQINVGTTATAGFVFHPDGERFYVSNQAGKICVYRAPRTNP